MGLFFLFEKGGEKIKEPLTLPSHWKEEN